ncbi:helix-turn-helix domain-containing protein [Paenibacillus elgii]|uniref:helix-turn-helix domain-containing protein n=1 Tax=Paenibacillus elgii TaxID=189691 RepID=UPI0013D27D9C|nr:helix-turn-helix domain-containing protein [Paenibacillus elgii]MCM3268640.1 AraC family transcriptional regulator [Paenibacillus elgii]
MLRLLPEKTYLRNFLNMGLLFTVIILLFSYLLRQQYSRQAYEDINQLMATKTDSLSQGFEYQLDHLRSYALNIYQDPEITNWLMSDQNEPLSAAAAFKSVSKYMSLQSYIASTYLVNRKTGQVINSKDGIHTFADFEDQAMLTRMSERPPTMLRFFDHTMAGQSYLALTVPSNRSPIAGQGYVVILLDKGLLEKYLLQNLNDATASIRIVDGERHVILGGSDAFDTRLLQPDLKNHQVYLGDNVYLIHAHAFKVEDWTLYSTVKLKDISKNIDRIELEILGMCLFLLLLLSALTFWNSRRHFKPFSQLASQMKKTVASTMPAPGNKRITEFAIIKSGLDHMVKSMEEMNNVIRNHQEVIKNEFMRQWVLQGTYNEAFLQTGGLRLQALLSSDIYLAIMRINRFQAFSERYSYASRKLLLYAMGNIAGEVLAKHGFISETVDLGSDHLVVMIGGGGQGVTPAQALYEARQEIGNWLQFQVTVALSGRTAVQSNIRAVYDRTCDLTLLRFFNEQDKVYAEEDLGPYWSEPKPDFDEKLVQELIQSVRKSHKEKAREQLDKLFARLQTLTYAECQFQLKLLLFYMFKAFNKVMADQETGGADLLLQKFDTLMDVKDWIYSQCVTIIDSVALKHSTSNRKEELASEIFDYVKQRLHDPMLTLESIADYLVLSVSYVRLVFKETYLVTLSDFIHQERLEQAKKLLVSTDLPVLDIAERSGFQSKTTFFTSFKKYTGLTPNQYREQNSE